MGPTQILETRCDWLTLYRLLERMAPWQRVAWLHACCRVASTGQHPVKVAASRGELDEVWLDYRSIAGQGQLTVDRAGEMACKVLKRG